MHRRIDMNRIGLLALLLGGCVVHHHHHQPAPRSTAATLPRSDAGPPGALGGTTYGGTTYGGLTYGATPPAAPSLLDPPGSPLPPAPPVVTTASAPAQIDAAWLANAKTFLVSLSKTHHLYASLLRFVNHPSGRASMLAGTRDGIFIGAMRRTPTPRNEYAGVATVYKLDPAGVVTWTANVGEPGFATFEVMSVVATPDGGAIAQVLAYKHPARNPNTRFVKLDRDGRRAWVFQLPGDGNTDCPHAEVVRADGRGGLAIHGYWVRRSELTDINDWAGHLRDWFGAISPDGKLVKDVVGDLIPTGRIESWPEPHPLFRDL